MEAEALRFMKIKAEDEALGSRMRTQWAGVSDENDDSNVTTALQLPGALESGPLSAAAETAASSAIRGHQRSKKRFYESNEDDNDDRGLAGASDKGARVLFSSSSRIVMYVPGIGVRPFTFSRVFDSTASQEAVYTHTAREAVLFLLNGFNTCVLCYGQTGSGKTHTIFGPDGIMEDALRAERLGHRLPSSVGVVVRACAEILRVVNGHGAALALGGVSDADTVIKTRNNTSALMAENSSLIELLPGRLQYFGAITTRLSVQYVQIYQEQVTDLITGRSVEIRYASGSATGSGSSTNCVGSVLHGAAEVAVANMGQLLALLSAAEAYKQFGATAMNHRSSRAHTVFVLTVTQVLCWGLNFNRSNILADRRDYENLMQIIAVLLFNLTSLEWN